MAALWEKDVSGSYFRTLRKDLIDTLTAAGCENILIQQRGIMGVCAENISCDLYDWLRGVPDAQKVYRGEYMAQYSWAELMHGVLTLE